MSWEPLELDYPGQSQVRVVPHDAITEALTGPLREDLADNAEKVWRPPADRVRIQVLEQASDHITKSLSELTQALSWFSVVDRADHSELVRQVEGLADTIGYRLRNAGE